PRRGGNRMDLEDAGRGRARRVEAEPAISVGPALAQQSIVVTLVAGADPRRAPPGDQVDGRALDRPAVWVEHAAGDGHPLAERTRRLGGARLRPSRLRLRLAGRLALPGACGREGQVSRSGGDGGEGQRGDRDELELVDQHGTEDLLGNRRGGSGEG